MPGDLDRASDLLNNTIIPALKNVGDPARKTALEDQAKGAAREMWFTYLYEKAAGRPDAISAAFTAAPKLEIRDADLATLEPWAAYDWERWKLLNQVATVKDPDPKKQLDAIQTMVQAFQKAVAAKNLGDLEAVKAMAVRLKPFADGKDLDLAHEGPGRVIWKNAAGQPEWAAQANDDGTIVTYSWKGPSGRQYALEFRRVFEDPAGESNGYLCTTEMSLGLFIDLVQRAEKWDELHTIVKHFRPRQPARPARVGVAEE